MQYQEVHLNGKARNWSLMPQVFGASEKTVRGRERNILYE
jgi:hypothetical protein